MKPVAWIKVRELDYMKAVAQHGKDDWQTNLGLKPEPDDEGLYTETQVQQLRESFEQSITDPENQPSQYGTVPLEWYLRDEALLRQALEALELSRIYMQNAIRRASERGAATDTIRDLNDDLTYHDDTIAALREPLTEEAIDKLDCIPNVPGIHFGDVVDFARAIERAHGIGGGV